MKGWKVLLVLAIVGMFVMPMMPVKVKADNVTSTYHYWHDKKLIWWMWSVAKYANDDDDMNTGNTYQELRDFFYGCTTIEQFYDRIQYHVEDAQSYSEADTTSRKLSDIVEEVKDGHASLLCYQQAILFAGGVKAIFSEWNGERYVLKPGYNDFTFYFNVKFEGYPQGHIQLVIDKWNGQDWFYDEKTGKWYDRWEVDTWEKNQPPRPWNPDEGWKDNSKMWTDTSSGTTSTDQKTTEEYNWTEIENVISISGDNHWYEYWLEDSLINDYYNYIERK